MNSVKSLQRRFQYKILIKSGNKEKKRKAKPKIINKNEIRE